MFQIVSLFPREAVFAEHKRQIGQHMKYNTVLRLFPINQLTFYYFHFVFVSEHKNIYYLLVSHKHILCFVSKLFI